MAKTEEHIPTEGHTVKRFDQDLAHLRNVVLEMGGMVEEQIDRAVQALMDGDLSSAREVIDRDHLVNGLDVKANEECTRLIALRAPVAGDLRLLMSLSKTVTDLERIGDEAEKIARMAIHIYERDTNLPNHGLLRDVWGMARLASDMLKGSLDALARMDTDRAAEAARMDADVDEEFRAALRRLTTYVMEDPRTIGFAIDILFAIKALERIGDHSKNITEYVVYLVKGKDIRHTGPMAS